MLALTIKNGEYFRVGASLIQIEMRRDGVRVRINSTERVSRFDVNGRVVQSRPIKAFLSDEPSTSTWSNSRAHRCRLLLECGHQVEKQFPERPTIGQSVSCPQCTCLEAPDPTVAQITGRQRSAHEARD